MSPWWLYCEKPASRKQMLLKPAAQIGFFPCAYFRIRRSALVWPLEKLGRDSETGLWFHVADVADDKIELGCRISVTEFPSWALTKNTTESELALKLEWGTHLLKCVLSCIQLLRQIPEISNFWGEGGPFGLTVSTALVQVHLAPLPRGLWVKQSTRKRLFTYDVWEAGRGHWSPCVPFKSSHSMA